MTTVFTEFAPNEHIQDALLSIRTFLQPWKWKTGEELALIEKKISTYFPNSKMIPFLTGRATLFSLLTALNLNQKDEIVITGFTCEAVVLPIIKKGYNPIYVDIETDTFSINITDLAKKITSQTKVIILQHTFGMIPKYRNEVLGLAKSKNIFVIEDLAHGFNPSHSHSLTPSDKTALILSFGRSKAVSSVFGGAVVLSNTKLIQTINNDALFHYPYPSFLQITQLLLYKPIAVIIKVSYSVGLGKLLHHITKYLRLITAEISQNEKRGEYDIVFAKRYPNALATLLYYQLSQFETNQKKRIDISNVYYSQLKQFRVSSHSQSASLRFPLLVEERKKILNEFGRRNIYLGQWYNQPVAPYPLPLDKVGYKKGMCPVAEQVCKTIINLPTTVTKKEAMKIIKYYFALINK